MTTNSSEEILKSVIQEENIIRLDAEQYAWLVQMLDAPPRDLPELRDLLREKPIWETSS